MNATTSLDTLWRDLRYGARAVIAQPGFSVVAIATLAIAIGANSAIFSFVDGALLKPLPYSDPDSIVMLWEKTPNGDRNGISTLNFLDWKEQNTVFEDIAALSGGSFILTGDGNPQQFNGRTASASYFDLMGVQAALGRTFAPDEDQPGKERVLVLSNRMWRDYFGADPEIIGRGLMLNAKPFTVIGVLPAGSFDRQFSDLWAPLAFTPERMTRDFHWFTAVGRLKPGITLEQAQAEMDSIGARIAQDYPDIKKGWGVVVDRFEDRFVGDQMRQSLYVLLAAVCAVLLIGCANLANLTLARNAVRARDIAVRSSLGAGRMQLIRQMITESMVIALLGGAAGIALGYGLMRAIKLSMPRFTLPPEVDVQMDWRVLVFTLVVTVVTGVLFGLAPALQATRGGATAALKDGGRGSTHGAAQHRLRDALVVSEVALAFMLLTGAGLLIRSFNRLLDVDAGFETTNTVTMSLRSAEGADIDGPKLHAYHANVLEAVRAIPGVRNAATTSALPMRGWGYGMPFQIAGKDSGDRAARQACFFRMVSPSYFQTIGMRLKRGRFLANTDQAGGAPVAVINETMAQRFFANEDPLGRHILVEQIVPGKPELGAARRPTAFSLRPTALPPYGSYLMADALPPGTV